MRPSNPLLKGGKAGGAEGTCHEGGLTALYLEEAIDWEEGLKARSMNDA
jgi:hypothetical protein